MSEKLPLRNLPSVFDLFYDIKDTDQLKREYARAIALCEHLRDLVASTDPTLAPYLLEALEPEPVEPVTAEDLAEYDAELEKFAREMGHKV
jgi:hypothetical protein